MKIRTLGKHLVASLLLVNVLIATISYFWFKSYQELDVLWQRYSENVERKTALIGLIKDALGYGGMIHDLKNYVLRGDPKDLLNAHFELHEINIMLITFTNLPMSEREQVSLESIEGIIELYYQAAIKAEQLKLQGMEVALIDKAIEVDDTVAIKAIRDLKRLMNEARHQHITTIAQKVKSLEYKLVIAALTSFLMLLLLAVVFYWYVNRRLVKPIYHLLLSLERIDLSKHTGDRLPVSSKSNRTELDDLAHSANRFLDIAEQHMQDLEAAEGKAREDEYRMAAILNSTAEGIITIDKQGRILSFNPKCEGIFGYRADEVIGKNVNCLMRSNEREAHQQYLDNAAILEKRIINANRELWGQRKNKEVFPMELTVSSVQLNEQTCYIGILHDISVRKLNEQKLLKAKTEAESANRAKSQFLSAMSHELRTPMNAILGFGQLLLFNRKESLSVSQQDNVEQILQAGQHLLALINDILDLSKIESGNLDIDFEQVELSEVLAECLELTKNQALGRQVKVSCELPDELPMVYADFTRIKQVLLNLITNAIKYNQPEGLVEINATLQDSTMVRVSVTDNGVGIEESHFKDVFEPFARFDKRAHEIEGTGIGLSVCASLVESMHGKIDFTSERGKGSTFFVDMPVAKEQMLERRASGNERDGAVQRLEYDNKTLLHVEDNQANRNLMKVLIKDVSNLVFIEATDAETALEIVHDSQIDIIFMDINLPGMDGVSAMRHLQASPLSRDIPVIAISAAATKQDIRKGIMAGFRAYLTKPLQVTDVIEVIKQVLAEGDENDL